MKTRDYYDSLDAHGKLTLCVACDLTPYLVARKMREQPDHFRVSQAIAICAHSKGRLTLSDFVPNEELHNE
jgi:hypothetical protein